MKKTKIILDECQEQQLLQIEHNGFWMAYWGLAAIIIIQCIFMLSDIRMYLGELIVFAVLTCYGGSACVRRGIWDRRFAMDIKTILGLSAAGGSFIGVCIIVIMTRTHDSIRNIAISTSIGFVVAFVILFISLGMYATIVKKSMSRLNKEPEE